MSSTNDIVETFPEGSHVQGTFPVIAVYSDGSYSIRDVEGNPVRVQVEPGFSAVVGYPPVPEEPDDPPILDPEPPVEEPPPGGGGDDSDGVSDGD